MERAVHVEDIGAYRISIYPDPDPECPLEWGDHVKEGDEVYAQWADGDVWGFVIEKVDYCPCCGSDTSEEVDSLWGCYGYDYCLSEAREAVAAMASD